MQLGRQAFAAQVRRVVATGDMIYVRVNRNCFVLVQAGIGGQGGAHHHIVSFQGRFSRAVVAQRAEAGSAPARTPPEQADAGCYLGPDAWQFTERRGRLLVRHVAQAVQPGGPAARLGCQRCYSASDVLGAACGWVDKMGARAYVCGWGGVGRGGVGWGGVGGHSYTSFSMQGQRQQGSAQTAGTDR